MKTLQTILKSGITASVLAALFITAGCAKDDVNDGPANSQEKQISNPRLITQIDQQVQDIPKIVWYNTTMEKYIVLDPKSPNMKAEFVDANEVGSGSHSGGTLGLNGAAFVLLSDAHDPDYNSYLHFASRGEIGYPLSSFQSISGRNSIGTLVAGETTMDLNSVAQISNGEQPSEEVEGLFGLGGIQTPNTGGATTTVAFSGDMEALTTNNFENEVDIFQFINGLAFIVVFNAVVNGTFPILNWFNYINMSSSYLHGNAFIWIYSFTVLSWSIYFSQKGLLKSTNNGLEFNGALYEATVDSEQNQDSGDENEAEIKYLENVPSYVSLKREY